jgi:hypothetical protein
MRRRDEDEDEDGDGDGDGDGKGERANRWCVRVYEGVDVCPRVRIFVC